MTAGQHVTPEVEYTLKHSFRVYTIQNILEAHSVVKYIWLHIAHKNERTMQRTEKMADKTMDRQTAA